MHRQYTVTGVVYSIATAAFVACVCIPTAEVLKSEPEYIAKVKTAARVDRERGDDDMMR